MEITNQRCEYSVIPICIDCKSPRFSWNVVGGDKPSAYRIIVHECGLSSDFLCFDSGIVNSGVSEHVYDGAALKSLTSYKWQVVLYSGDKPVCTAESVFRTAFLDPALWPGCWIGSVNGGHYAPLLRKSFIIEKPVKSAFCYLAADGYCELWLNGAKQGDSYLNPSNTDIEKTVPYVTYDIKDCLRKGSNVIGCWLARSWTEHPRLRLAAYITYSDGTADCIYTSPSAEQGWKMLLSPILSSAVYSGEVYNAHYDQPDWCNPDADFESEYHHEQYHMLMSFLPEYREKNPEQYEQYRRAWFPAVQLPQPQGVLRSQMQEPIRIIEHIKPAAVTRTGAGVAVFDFGQNFSGFVKISIPGNKRVVIKYSEFLNPDGSPSMDYLCISDPSYQLPMQTDIIYSSDEALVYQPRFTYHGFRYAGVEGFDEITENDVVGVVVHSNVSQTGKFTCANSLINAIQKNILWTERSNLFSIPTDCPQRSERHGWLNDLTVRAEAAVYNYGLCLFFAKFMQDISDTQDPVSGAIADTAPYRRGNRPADPVSSAYLILPMLLSDFYGEHRLIERHYDGMKSWTMYLLNNATDYIVNFSLYGDWASPIEFCVHNGLPSAVSCATPGLFVSTGYLYYNLRLMARFAESLGKTDDLAEFRQTAELVKRAINEKFLDNYTGNYAGGSQASNTFALWLDIVPREQTDKTLDSVVRDIVERDYHLTTGNLMTKYIFEVLSRYGKTDMAFRLVTQTTYPSWGYMISKGATTIWERWEYETGYGMNSHSHPMYGSISAWFYKYLVGITPKNGFKQITVQPHIPADLDSASAALDTVLGAVHAGWSKQNGKLTMNVSVPDGAAAEIFVPVNSPQAVVCSELEGRIIDVPYCGYHMAYVAEAGEYIFTTDI